LLEKEKQLLDREEQVEETRRELEQHKERDRRMVQEARHLEQRYKDRLMELQAQASSLTEREKKLAEEKLLISKERLALYASPKPPSTKKCTLCEAEANRSDPTLFKISVSLPKLLFLGQNGIFGLYSLQILMQCDYVLTTQLKKSSTVK